MSTFSDLFEYIHRMPYPLKITVIIFLMAFALFVWSNRRTPPKK